MRLRPVAVAAEPPLQVPAADGCPHYAQHWGCNGEWSLTCAIERGQSGVLDGDECRGSDRVS